MIKKYLKPMKIINLPNKGGGGGGEGGEEVGSIGGIQLQPLRTLPSGAACAEETPAPVSACTVTAGNAPAAAE